MSRRAARNQPLPSSETAELRSLNPPQLYDRCAALFNAGWTLQAIGDALLPPRSRSTVRSWVQRPHQSLPTVPVPTLRTPPTYVPRRAPSPGITPSELATIQALAPQARQYRAGMPSTSTPAVSNSELTQLVRHLHSQNVSIPELARAANVTYRAMARRLGTPNN